jgi:glutaminase
VNQFLFEQLFALTPSQLELLANQAKAIAKLGRLPEHIPLLSEADPAWFALQIQSVKGQVLAVGAVERTFALMSVVKPFLLLFLLEQFGMDAVFNQVGKLPSSYPFNSLIQLRADQGWARNPLINSGAIVLASHLPGKDAASRCETLQQWLNQLAGCHLYLDEQILASVRSLRNETNWKIAQRLAEAGYLTDITTTLDTYNHICCLAGTIADLANLGLLLAQPLVTISPTHQQVVSNMMLTCGLYEASKDFALQVGLPTKSGVSGALLTVIPERGAIACYSPPLDRVGNSIASLFAVEQLQRMMTI